MSVSIRDIAFALGISPSTVSSALSASPQKRRISAARAAEVRAKAEGMGYIPNKLAGRIFGRSKRKNVALVFKNDTAGERTLPALEYAIRRLGERGECDYSVLYAKDSNLTGVLKAGIGLGIRDFIILGYLRGKDLAAVKFAQLPEIRLYAADYYFDESDDEFPALALRIGFDREEFYRNLTRELAAAGLGPVLTAYALEAGQEPPEEAGALFYRVEELDDLFRFGSEVLAPRIVGKVRAGECRTLLLRNDSMAVGVMETLLASGIRIPEDLALIGFNNSPFAPYAKIPLTTVALPLEENLQQIFSCLLDGEKIPAVVRRKPRLVLRQSTPALPEEFLRLFR